MAYHCYLLFYAKRLQHHHRRQQPDGIGDDCDNCVLVSNQNQTDYNFNNIGTVCDGYEDQDDDGIPDVLDNCKRNPNADQMDTDKE